MAAWTLAFSREAGVPPASSELESATQRLRASKPGQQRMCLKRCRCFPDPAPQLRTPDGSQPPTRVFIATLAGWFLPGTPAPLADKSGKGWQAEVEVAQLSSLKSCRN